MKKIVFIFIMLFSSISLLHSQIIFNADNIVINNEVVGQLTIENYSNITLYKNEKCNFNSSTAEYLFCKFFNLNTTEDLTAFFSPHDIPSSYKEKDYLDKMKIYNKRNNFYTLDSKYTFDNGISKDIFIKYINNNEVFLKPIYSVFYIQEFSNNLVVKDMGENFDLGLFLLGSNTSKTINYFNSIKPKVIDITLFCNDFFENIKKQSKVNYLYDIIDKKYSPIFNSNDETFINENILSNNFTYKKTFHDLVRGVVFEKNKMSKNEISEKYMIPINYLTKDSLAIKEVINVNTINKDITIIKFYDFQPIIKTDSEILNEAIISNNNLLFVLTKLDFEFFINLYFDRDNNKYPEINKFKTSITDTNNTLNISKLAALIRSGKIPSKYLEK